MKKAALFLPLLFISLPHSLNALTNSLDENRAEISQVWIDRHNEKLPLAVRGLVKKLKARRHSQILQSFHRHTVPMRRLSLSRASFFGVPAGKPRPAEDAVPLAALYQARAQGQTFLIADYADDLDPLNASSDIYLKIGLKFWPILHGQGYRGCARVITLGNNLPVFFEVDAYGGGARCDRTYFILNKATVPAMTEEVYDHPEMIDPQSYVLETIKIGVWLEGFTLYKDVDGDGALEIVNSTDAECPPDLKTLLKDKYKLVDNDFAGAFRKTFSVYKWNDSKSKFEDLGDYYYSY